MLSQPTESFYMSKSDSVSTTAFLNLILIFDFSREGKGRRKREKHPCERENPLVGFSRHPGQESNLPPFGLWANPQPTEPPWPGLQNFFILTLK